MAALLAHNLYRTRHKSPPLKLNQQLSREAEVEAKHLAKYGRTQNDRQYVLWNTNKGENVARGCNKLGLTASGAVKRWYDEVCSYDWSFKGIVPKARRFMQLIWKGTHEFGIGRAAGFKKGQLCTYIVARYKPGLMNNFTFESSIDKGFFNPTSCKRNKPGAWRKMVKVHRLHSTNADGFSNHLNKNLQGVRQTAKSLSAPLQSGSSLPTDEPLEYDDAAVSQNQLGEKDPLPYSATLQDPNGYPGYRSKDDMHSSISQRMEDFIWPDESDDKSVYNDFQSTPKMQEQNVNSPNKIILEDSKDFPHNDQDDLPSNELPQSDEYSSQFDSDAEPQPQDDFTLTFDSDADRQHLSDDVEFHKPDEDNLFNLDDGRMDDNNKKRGMNKRQSGKIK